MQQIVLRPRQVEMVEWLLGLVRDLFPAGDTHFWGVEIQLDAKYINGNGKFGSSFGPPPPPPKKKGAP